MQSNLFVQCLNHTPDTTNNYELNILVAGLGLGLGLDLVVSYWL